MNSPHFSILYLSILSHPPVFAFPARVVAHTSLRHVARRQLSGLGKDQDSPSACTGIFPWKIPVGVVALLEQLVRVRQAVWWRIAKQNANMPFAEYDLQWNCDGKRAM